MLQIPIETPVDQSKGYVLLTGTPNDIASLKSTIDTWLDGGYSVDIRLLGKPGGCTPGHPC